MEPNNALYTKAGLENVHTQVMHLAKKTNESNFEPDVELAKETGTSLCGAAVALALLVLLLEFES